MTKNQKKEVILRKTFPKLTVGCVVERLREGRCPAAKLGRQVDTAYTNHCRSLFGPRKRGSTTARGLEFLPTNLPLEDVTNAVEQQGLHQPGCSYFKAVIANVFREDFKARIGVISLRELMELHSDEVHQNPLVELRDAGSHGIDLVFQMHADHASDFMEDTDHLTFIFGPKPEEMWDDDDDMTQDHETILYTWHPGPVMSRGSNELTMDSMIKLEVMNG